MRNILNKIQISYLTYIFILICLFCGFIKNILIIFFICLFHELGHIFFIKIFKYQIIKIEILPFGGYTEIHKRINSNITKDLIISLGGILFQVILFIFLFILKDYFNIITYNLFIKYNMFILFFNLIPIIPLDGNKLLTSFMELFLPFHHSYYLSIFFSLIFLTIFVYMNYKYNFDNYFICSFLLYKIILCVKNYKYVFKRFLLERSLYKLEYAKIDNHTKDIKSLRKNVLHYFKKNNKYIREDHIINEYFGLKN